MSETKEKFKVISKLLHDEYVIIQLNPACEGIALPQHLLTDVTVSLKLSKLFSGGMEVLEDKITANLSFGNEYFSCSIPFDSIWSATSIKNETTIWPGSAPQEYLKSLLNKAMEPKDPAKDDTKRPVLKRIK